MNFFQKYIFWLAVLTEMKSFVGLMREQSVFNRLTTVSKEFNTQM